MSINKEEKELEVFTSDIMNKIHHRDCLEFMKQVPDDYFDLILTDPPYGINIAKKGSIGGGSHRAKAKDFGAKKWDSEIPTKEIFEEMKRISKHQIIFGGNYFIEHLENTRCFLTWFKHENLPERTFANSELAWTNFDKNSNVYCFQWDGFIQQDMANKEKRHHPTQKPTELFKMILRDYAIKLDKKTIFDPFMGSGTTAIASKALGLNWCGCELEADYVEIANKRLEKVQGSLF